MSDQKHNIWIFILSAILALSYGQEWEISREHTLQISKKNAKLNCSSIFTDEIIQLIIDYALWRNVAMLYIVDESISSGCNMKAIRQNLDCFNSNGLSIALQKKFYRDSNPNSQAKRILVVSFIKADMDFDSYLKQIKLLTCYDDHFKWLNIYANITNIRAIEKRVLETLRSSALTLSVDAVIAIATSNSSKEYKRRLIDCSRRPAQTVPDDIETAPVKTLLPFNKTLEKNETFNVTFKGMCGTPNEFYDKYYCMLQIYKIRKGNNASMVVRPLGFWNYETGTEKLKPYQSVETRLNFYSFPIIFGKKRFTQETNVIAEESLIEDDNDEENMGKISEFISSFLNATPIVKMYPNLGLKAASGNWTGLLGAVVAHEVDLGLDSVIKIPDRYSDMIFTHDIMISIRNIYVKPEPSHTARDIFLAPFEAELIFSVLGTGLIFAVAMTVYIVTSILKSREKSVPTTYLLAISDALLWVLGVLSMQGTQIQPRSYSGNIIVVISLVFALIIYNSYSAFITSMLSVKLTQIRTVDDLLESDYDIGYTKNSQDEIFLRSMNESQLNQIYLRGYLHNNINNITDGLLKATKGNYGFFATGHVARKQFLKISGYKCKHEIMEIPVSSTVNTVAFPMSHTSPYRKSINLCLIKMMEVGIHQYINTLIAPGLPQCDQQTKYQSARLNDLITSFGLLALGVLIGFVMVLLECFWKKKKLIFASLRRRYKSIDRHFDFVH